MAQSVTVDFNANVTRFTSALDKATNDLNKFQSNADRMSKNIGKAFAGLGLGLSVAGITAFAKSTIDAADSLNDLSAATSLTVEQLAGLSLVAETSGTDLDALAGTINKLTVNMGKDAKKFADMGIDAKDPIEAFKQLSDIFVGLKTPQERAAFGAEALGKSWAVVAPVLIQGSQAIGEMIDKGTSASGSIAEMAKNSDEFNDKIAIMQAQIIGLANDTLTPLLPILSTTIEYFGSAGDKAKSSSSDFGILKTTFETIAIVGANVAFVFRGVGREIVGMAAQIAALARGELSGFSAISDAMKKDAEQARAELDAFEQSILNPKKSSAATAPAGTATTPGKLRSFIGGGSKEEKQQELRDYDQHIKEFVKIQDEANKEMTQSALEAQRIIADIDPIYKATLAWEELSALVEKGFITAEQAGQSYASNFQKSTDEMSSFAKRAGENIQDSFAEFLFDPFKDGLGGMLKNFQTTLQRMAAQAAASKILGSIGEWGSTGSGAGTFIGGIAASMFGGGKAIGGPVTGGKTYLVGERGPELFTPSGSGNITPNDKLGKSVTVVNNFTISQPTDRRTQEQIASMAGASVQKAMLRGA